MRQDSINAFILLLRAGLWGGEIRLLPYKYSLKEIYELAKEQSVVGIVAAGLELITDIELPKHHVFTFIGDSLLLEQRNVAMNHFIEVLLGQMANAGINAVLVKGQGVAQCYEKPLWRACGDVDLLFDQENYEKAKSYLLPLAESQEPEDHYFKHFAIFFSSWEVELHGTLRGGLWEQIDKGLDDIHGIIFKENKVRVWNNNGTYVLLPCVDEDLIIIFTHILQHFFREGIGLRQICDWCRVLWVYKDKIDKKLLERRLRSMRIMTEWKAFAAFAVDELGMREDVIPFYSDELKWGKKARVILTIVLRAGNFGQNKNNSYYSQYPRLIIKGLSFLRHTRDCIICMRAFPLDSLKVWALMVKNGLKAL